MKMLALLLCLAVPCFAAPTSADAPVKVKAGDLVPFDGVLDTAPATVQTERLVADLSARVASYEKAPPVAVAVVIAVVATAVGLAAGAGGMCLYVATRPKP